MRIVDIYNAPWTFVFNVEHSKVIPPKDIEGGRVYEVWDVVIWYENNRLNVSNSDYAFMKKLHDMCHDQDADYFRIVK